MPSQPPEHVPANLCRRHVMGRCRLPQELLRPASALRRRLGYGDGTRRERRLRHRSAAAETLASSRRRRIQRSSRRFTSRRRSISQPCSASIASHSAIAAGRSRAARLSSLLAPRSRYDTRFTRAAPAHPSGRQDDCRSVAPQACRLQNRHPADARKGEAATRQRHG